MRTKRIDAIWLHLIFDAIFIIRSVNFVHMNSDSFRLLHVVLHFSV
jgi:hypothetical protein